jgi:hypothetical protein
VCRDDRFADDDARLILADRGGGNSHLVGEGNSQLVGEFLLGHAGQDPRLGEPCGIEGVRDGCCGNRLEP